MNPVEKKVKELSRTLYKPFEIFRKKQEKFAKKYENVEYDGILHIDGIEFNMCFTFDDIFYVKEDDTVLVMNLFYADLEKEKSDFFLNKHFPSFNKIIKMIDTLREPEEGGYIAIGKNVTLNDDISMVLETYEEFEEYATKFLALEPLMKSFLKEVEKYAKNQIFIEVSNSGIKECSSNGGRKQEILFKTEKNVFKISILSESYTNQSYGSLYILSTDKKWTLLKRINPKTDYRIDISYKNNYDKFAFDPIIKDLKKIAEQLDV